MTHFHYAVIFNDKCHYKAYQIIIIKLSYTSRFFTGHASSQLKKGQTTEKKVLDSGQLSSSEQQIRFVAVLRISPLLNAVIVLYY